MRKKLLVSMATLVVGVVLVEAALRILTPLHPTGIQKAYRYDDDVGYVLQSDIHMFMVTDHLEETKTNRLGTVNFVESFDRYQHLVFAAGASFVAGTGLPADDSFPFQMDQKLNLTDDGQYTWQFGVVNLGLAAHGTEQATLIAKRYADRIAKPDILIFHGSDADYLLNLRFRAKYAHKHIVRDSPYWGIFYRPALMLSNLEVVKRLKMAVSRMRAARIYENADDPSQSASASVAELTWPQILALVEYANAGGIHLILSWSQYPTESYDWLRLQCEEEGIAFADWGPAVDAMNEAMPALSRNNPHSGGHLRSWVNDVIAAEYARLVHSHVEGLVP